jgi:hypothetical protein
LPPGHGHHHEHVAKEDPLGGAKKWKVLSYTFFLVIFMLVSINARPTQNIFNQNQMLREVLCASTTSRR